MMDSLTSLRGSFFRLLVFASLGLAAARNWRYTLRLADQRTIFYCLLIFGGIAIVTFALDNARGCVWIEIDHVPRMAFDGRVSVNESRWPALCILPGVGESLARRIERDRNERGEFLSVRELSRVAGLGQRGVTQMEPWIDVRRSQSPSLPRGY